MTDLKLKPKQVIMKCKRCQYEWHSQRSFWDGQLRCPKCRSERTYVRRYTK